MTPTLVLRACQGRRIHVQIFANMNRIGGLGSFLIVPDLL